MKENDQTINFMQYNLYNYINAPKNKTFFINMMTEYGINHSQSPGYCYGLTNEFLIYEINNKGADYIQQLNYLYDIINFDSEGLSAIDKVKYDALKMHAQVLLNDYIYGFIKIQGIHNNTLRNKTYFDSLAYDEINNRVFRDYLNDIIDKNFNKAVNENKKDKVYYQYLYESQKIKLKEYINALYVGEDFFNTKEGEIISSDPIFLKLKDRFIRGGEVLGNKYSVSDANFFIDSISESVNRDNYLKLELINKKRGVQGNNIHQNYSFNTLKGTTVKRFKDVVIGHTAKNKTPLYYQLILGNHVVVVSAKYNNKNKSWEYKFFDPNYGVAMINKQVDFFSYLDSHIKKIAKESKIPIFENDYNIAVSEFVKNGNSGIDFKKINNTSLKITENVLLAERGITYQKKGSKCKIIYKEFNPENCLLKIKVVTGSTEFIAYTDILDGQDLYTRIINNPETIAKIKKDVFISQDGYKIYSINKNFDIKTFENINKSHNNQNIARDYIRTNLHLKPLSSNEPKAITGIPENHQRAITQVANDYNVIIGMRPIDYKSTSLIASGLYGSKGLMIKGKSSDWGPHSGFIPILQQFAKKSGRDEQEKYNGYITQSIEQGHAKPVILEVTHERMNELLKYGAVTSLEDIGRGDHIRRTTAKVDNVPHSFILNNITRGETKLWQVFYQSGHKTAPFLVVGDPKTGKAMTADYDLFSVIYPVSELEHYVKVSEMPSWQEWKASVNYDELTNEQKKLYHNEAEYNKREGKDNGITNAKIKEINQELNKKLERPIGLELVHHGADDANPGSVMKDNFPIAFFLPDKLKGKNKLSGTRQSIGTYFQMNSSGAVIINDVESLSNFQQLLINEGYRAPLNANWREGEYAEYFNPKRKISDSYINASREIQRKKSIPIAVRNFIEGKETQSGYIDNIENNFGKPFAKLEWQPHHQLTVLLEKIALKEISIQDINKTDHAYLLTYFSDGNGNIDIKKLKIAVSDPLVNRKLNEYLSQNAETNILSLELLLESSISSSYQQQASDIQTLLIAIKNDLSILNHLSERSQNILMKLFPAGDRIDKGKILELVTDNHKLISFNNRLNEFSELSSANFIGENAPFKKYSFTEAFYFYEQSQAQRLAQFNQQLMYGNKVELLNHGVIRSGSQNRGMDQTLGGTYAIEFYLADGHLARDFIERKSQIEQAIVKNTSTSAERSLLKKMEQYSQYINIEVHKNGISIADQPIGNLFSAVTDTNNVIIFLKGKSVTYTVTHVQRNGGYEISLFDPQGIQLSVKNRSSQQAQQQFQRKIKHYFSENLQLSNGEFRADFQFIDLDSTGFKTVLSSMRNQRQTIIDQAEFTLPKNRWVALNGEKIAFTKLQQLGATIKGKPISLGDLKSIDLHNKIRFSPDKLAMYFTLMEGGKEDLAFIKVFHEQLKSADIHQLVERQVNFAESGVLKRQFKYLANNVDAQQETIAPSTLAKVRQAGHKLPQFQRIANRAGQLMGATGAIQSLISAYAILDKLDNPDLSDEEIKELEKQFYLLAASALFNYGDMIVQPMLLNIASGKGATSLVRARIATGTVVIFNLVGMGIDIYQAYDSLSKLDSVTDPKQRQDLIVNASFSIASAVINGVTVIGILVGSSTIPVAGLVIGGILLVGGWIYSGVRAVENIKQVIDIDWDRELEEGIRGALGLDPTLRSQQEMNIQHYINAFKEQDWHMDLALFENNILQAGFAHHLSIIEKPTYENEPKYYLVDNYGNYFYGKLGNLYMGAGDTSVRFVRKGAPTFTADEIDFILKNKIVRTTAWFKNLKVLYEKMGWSIRHNFRLQSKEKAVFDLKNIGSIATHERYSLNSAYKSPLFEAFKARHQILDNELSLPLQYQLINSNPEQISFYSKKTEFGVLGQHMLRENERAFSEHIVNNSQRTALYIENTNSEGTSWNTANGNDVVIGKKVQKNAFQVLSGEKYFAGGDESDLFFIRDSCLASLTSREDNKPTKYLDGQGGQDIVIIDNLPDGYRVSVDLNENRLHYQRGGDHPFIPVAHLQNMENVMVRGNSNDHLQGNDTANILDGGLGKDILEGKEGDDKLILTQGIAAGGDGNDNYHIRRYEWLEHVDDLYLTERYFDRKEKAVKTRKSLNPSYTEGSHQFQAKVVIKESNYLQSRVTLEYFLDEIKHVQIDGNNLVLTLKQPKSSIDGHFFQHVESEVTIVLENVQDAALKAPHHGYQLQTLDGWVMTTVKDEKHPNQYFSLTYVQESDQLPSTNGKSVKIDESAGVITINQSRHYKKPTWGWFIPIGYAEQLTYRGNSENNVLPLIKLGSHIEVSHGIDTYQIVQGKEEYGEVEFDFSKVNDSFTDKDSLCLLLPTENGYSLYKDDGQLYSVDKFGQKKLAIKFSNVGNKISNAVLIQDKHSNLFKVNLQANRLSPVNPVKESSTSDDEIILPIGYLSEKNVIDGQSGDDTIINKGLESNVLLGGDGNDNIKVIGGNNLLYGGTGDNSISGGSGDDLLLSSQGNDTLMGGVGDDHYIIDGNQPGKVYIKDQIGNNHIHLINFKHQPTEKSDTEYQFYESSAGKLVKIKVSIDDDEGKFNIHHYERLDEKFSSSTSHGMAPLVNYLSEKLHKAKQSGEFTTWKPIDELTSTLNGVVANDGARPLNLTLKDDGIVLQQDCKRNNWLIDTLAGNDNVMDMSQQGRIIKGGSGNDKLITLGGENVLYGGQGNDVLLAQGMHQDVLISLDGKDQLAGTQGDDLYIVSGHGKGDVKITDVEGRNQVVLIDFNTEEVSYKQLSAKVAETTYRSKSGRQVTQSHNNHVGSMHSVMQVRHFNNYKELSKQHIEQTIDRLVQLLVEERIDYERNLDLSITNDNYQKNWGAVQITERFLSHLK
ncbi:MULTISPECIES: anthrax toxin-like adenylyl cyclase domain-containing protein [unclassified Providencia]|uniref:anthrax toxin-like adenylyl cyclase domain-containing protein n=1 Tax=unclassified Providencia TaxID=2633465 RepID=UPI00234B4507|nr:MULTISPECIES: anthrax toxin-like adenylyl cyclase domain-containing protein [unclassified Providencia]